MFREVLLGAYNSSGAWQRVCVCVCVRMWAFMCMHTPMHESWGFSHMP